MEHKVESRIFADRKTAGRELGRLLEVEYKDRHALVLGIARGGVVVAYEVAKIINGDLGVMVSKKLPFPEHEELAFGAIAEDGTVYLSPLAAHLNTEVINKTIAVQQDEINRRVNQYRQGKPLPLLVNRLVILVDDGIATGATLVPALQMIREKGASRIIVAVPIAGDNYVPEIARLADEIKIAEQPDNFHAVGQSYENFPSVTDEQVIRLIGKFDRGK